LGEVPRVVKSNIPAKSATQVVGNLVCWEARSIQASPEVFFLISPFIKLTKTWLAIA
jgi:hypothetical protein